MKLKKTLTSWIVASAIVVLPIAWASSKFGPIGEDWFGWLWNAYTMQSSDAEIRKGYFIDKYQGIRFKIPSGVYPCGYYGGYHPDPQNWSSGIDLDWPAHPALQKGLLVKVHWRKATSEAEPKPADLNRHLGAAHIYFRKSDSAKHGFWVWVSFFNSTRKELDQNTLSTLFDEILDSFSVIKTPKE